MEGIFSQIRSHIMHIHICVHTHAHLHRYLYVHTYTRIAVHAYMNFHLLMKVGMVRVYRILRVMPQSAINIPNICFVNNYGKIKKLYILNNYILYQLLGGFMGHRKTSIKDTHISPQATTVVTIEYRLYVLLLLRC